MTVSNTTAKLQYSGDGSNRVFGITFPLLSASHLKIVETDTNDVETDITANFSLNAAFNTLTYPTIASGLDPLASGHKLTVYRQTPATQEVDLQSGGVLDAEQLEKAYDKLTLQMQELREQITRAVKYPVSSNETGEATDFLNTINSRVAEAQTAATAAGNSQAACEQAVTDCGNRLGTASQCATAAANSALAASNASSAALGYKNDAAGSASAAEGYKETAGDYKDAAARSVTSAQGILDEIRTRVHKEFHLIAGTADATCGYSGSLTDFEIGIDMSALAVAVYVNGVLKTSSSPAQYSISTTKIVFPAAVTTGDSVVISLNGNLPNDDIAQASTSVQGIVQLATDAEVSAGTNSTKAIVPASLAAVLAGYQAALPSGTTGHFLKKTANGVTWEAVSGGGLTRFVVSYSWSVTVTSSDSGYYHTKGRLNISAAGTYLNIPNFKAARVVLCDANETVFCLSAGSFINICNISGNFADVYVYVPYAEIQGNDQLFTSSSTTVQIKVDLYY